jgi:hypothetical protein
MAMSGFQRRKDREARGLPRYTPGEAASRRERDVRRSKERKQELVQMIAALKVERGCVDCGYNAHSVALDFDHLPQFEKKQSVARMVLYARAWETIMAEINKCEVVCSNCHRVRTAQRAMRAGEEGVAALEAEAEADSQNG